MILAGDIGGTKTLLALYQQQGDDLKCIKKQRFVSDEFKTFESLLVEFLNNEKITAVCIGVAGPVMEGVCKATNLPWVLKTSQIQAQVGVEHVVLLNDLEATAWGILNLSAENFVSLNPQAVARPGNIAILAAGTGLGEAVIVWNGQSYHVMATEGGHTDFAPTNEEEILLLRYLMACYPEHVSYERIVSGDGLVKIYQFLKQKSDFAVNDETELQMQTTDSAAVVSQNAIKGNDPLCVKALTLFCRIYGAEAGNLALKCLPYGGVVLAGGIAAKVLPIIQQGVLMKGFLAKGRYHELLAQMPVKVCTNAEAALLGAAYYASKVND
ncbi:MAG: glucokinase [Methylococcales bacterium]|nr:glucokinase [Methylococcales bacterium]